MQEITNTIFQMDNLDVLRGIDSDTIDLVATDPPFNKGANMGDDEFGYPDQWKWHENVHPKWLESIQDEHPKLYHVIEVTRDVRGENSAAFICFFGIRLLEMHRVLKPTGSIYVHCDHSADAVIRLAMDAVFGENNFCNQIVWHYQPGKQSKRYFGRKHDSILFYKMSDDSTFHPQRKKITNPSNYRQVDENGDAYSDNGWGQRYYEKDGRSCDDVWSWIDETEMWIASGKERTEYPTQKPLELYKRIIRASSNEGDVVLDPFCGSGTTVLAAHQLRRNWIGIDRNPQTRQILIRRFRGITKEEEQAFIRDYGQEWLDTQASYYDVKLSEVAPERTDNSETTSEPLMVPYYPKTEDNQMPHKMMKDMLVDQFGLICWGCGREFEHESYLELDHISPQSENQSHNIDNRSLLCTPCNRLKKNRFTLNGLRKENIKTGFSTKERCERIDLKQATSWTRDRYIDYLKGD